MSTDRVTRQTVSIGDAAALYALAPSTVRWWESQGVLNPPDRDGGRRRYDDVELRRIGLAYLCCVVGKMPLDQAAVVTSGKAAHGDWQRTIGEQLALIDQRIEQLDAARDYLRHLLRCEDDDIVQCPILENELLAHTPRGRVAGADLVTAARTAGQQGRQASARDENPATSPRCDEKEVACPGCHGPVPRATRGRPRTYCSRACQQRAYRARHGRRAAAPSARGEPPT